MCEERTTFMERLLIHEGSGAVPSDRPVDLPGTHGGTTGEKVARVPCVKALRARKDSMLCSLSRPGDVPSVYGEPPDAHA